MVQTFLEYQLRYMPLYQMDSDLGLLAFVCMCRGQNWVNCGGGEGVGWGSLTTPAELFWTEVI